MAYRAVGGQQARHDFSRALQGALTLDEVEAAYMNSIGLLVDADAVGVYRLQPDSGEVLGLRANLDGDFLEEYEAYGRTDDPVLEFVRQNGRPIDSSRVVDPTTWQESGAHQALTGAGLSHSMEGPIIASGTFIGTINFARSPAIPSFSKRDLVSARLASEHMGLATERALRFELAGHRATTIECALDRLSQAVIVTDLDGQEIFRNRTARGGRDVTPVHGPAAQRNDQVSEHISEAMEEFRLRGKRVYTQSLKDPASGNHRIVKSYRLSDTLGAAVTFVFECAQQQGPRQLPVWEVLSRREQEIAQLVSEGLTTKQIAERAFISENTVKQHLKRVFAKTDVRNRAELVQLIWTAGESGPMSS